MPSRHKIQLWILFTPVFFIYLLCRMLFLTIWSKTKTALHLFCFYAAWQTIIPPSFPLFLLLMPVIFLRRQIRVKKSRRRVDNGQGDH